jgi:hypothetical protein
MKSRLTLLLTAAWLTLFSVSAIANDFEKMLKDTALKILGPDKFAQLKAVKGNPFLGQNRTWDITDAGGNKNRMTTTANSVCYERINAPMKVCADMAGKELSRTGFAATPDFVTGEHLAVLASPQGAVFDWTWKDCSSAISEKWLISGSLVGNGMGPISTKTYASNSCGGN